MNKEDILKILEGAKDKNGDVPMRLVRLAFKKLPEPCTDTISRKLAIDIVMFECGKWTGLAKEISKQLKQLPSAQPEIIHCRDCRWRNDQNGSTAWLPCRAIVTPSDFYCGRAERRTDE